jgi:hypothetical protein
MLKTIQIVFRIATFFQLKHYALGHSKLDEYLQNDELVTYFIKPFLSLTLGINA